MRQTLTMRNRLPEIAELQGRLEDLLQGCGCPAETIQDLSVVAEEILANTISYGYEGGEERTIEVRVETGPGVVRLEFRDDARAFDPLSREEPGPDAEEGLGGWGIPLIRQFTDRCEYVREGRFNVLRLERHH